MKNSVLSFSADPSNASGKMGLTTYEWIAFVLLSLAVLVSSSCSLLVSQNIPQTAAVLNFDLGEKDRSQGVLHLRENSNTVRIPLEVNPGYNKGNLDAIKLWLLDEVGNNREYPLAQMPTDNRWVLYRLNQPEEYYAAKIMAELWGSMGHWSPRFSPLELSINSVYLGSWLLSEVISRGPDRIPLRNLDVDDVGSYTIQGGYLYRFEDDSTPLQSENSFLTRGLMVADILYPDRLNTFQQVYISSFHNAFEIASGIGTQSLSLDHLSTFVDLNSLCDWIFLVEVSGLRPIKDFDVYLSKDRGEKMYFRPSQDYRQALQFNSGLSEPMAESLPFIASLMRDLKFQTFIAERWKNLRATKWTQSYAQALVRNTVAGRPETLPDPQQKEKALKMENALLSRLKFLDQYFNSSP